MWVSNKGSRSYFNSFTLVLLHEMRQTRGSFDTWYESVKNKIGYIKIWRGHSGSRNILLKLLQKHCVSQNSHVWILCIEVDSLELQMGLTCSNVMYCFHRPDTATFIQKMETLNKEKMENKDNRSFFAKYVSNFHSMHDAGNHIFVNRDACRLQSLHTYAYSLIPTKLALFK